jgi:modification methylase
LWAKIIIGDSRSMKELAGEAVDLIVTSPPYWHIKDYGVSGQIGHGETLHGYLKDLHRVWMECHRVLGAGARLCINIGDQFARSVTYGRYRVIPIHAEIIGQCESIGFDFMGSIIWQKKTTVSTTGGATVMGSYPYPPNGIVELDYEYIHIFKKLGKPKQVPKAVKLASSLTKEEWKSLFAGHWRFGGARQIGHEAMFPLELPARLVRMFSFVGDTVLDPFLGSGTTAKAALGQGRNAVGYEINPEFLEVIERKVGIGEPGMEELDWLEIVRKRDKRIPLRKVDYVPAIQDAKPVKPDAEMRARVRASHKVIGITDACGIRLDTGLEVAFLGVRVTNPAAVKQYLRHYLLGKPVLMGFDGGERAGGKSGVMNDSDAHRQIARRRDGPVKAYVYLTNRIFVNAYLLKSGLASADPSVEHRLKPKFLGLAAKGRVPKGPLKSKPTPSGARKARKTAAHRES